MSYAWKDEKDSDGVVQRSALWLPVGTYVSVVRFRDHWRASCHALRVENMAIATKDLDVAKDKALAHVKSAAWGVYSDAKMALAETQDTRSGQPW